jgi:hypothetical protein
MFEKYGRAENDSLILSVVSPAQAMFQRNRAHNEAPPGSDPGRGSSIAGLFGPPMGSYEP